MSVTTTTTARDAAIWDVQSAIRTARARETHLLERLRAVKTVEAAADLDAANRERLSLESRARELAPTEFPATEARSIATLIESDAILLHLWRTACPINRRRPAVVLPQAAVAALDALERAVTASRLE